MAVPEKLLPSYFQDPHPLQARLRQEGPVVLVEMPEGFNAWLVTRYADVRAALADPRLCKDWRKLTPLMAGNAGGDEAGDGADTGVDEWVQDWADTGVDEWVQDWADTVADGQPAGEADTPPDDLLSWHMLNLDPPDHERVRRLVTKAFTVRRVADLRPRIAEITASLLDDLAAREDDTVDLLESFAFPLPVTVISELLGIPASDRDKFRAWSDAVVSSVTRPEQMQAAAIEMIAYFSAQAEARRRSVRGGEGPGPSDDLLTALIHAQDEGDQLTTGELISMVFLLLVAGHETTVNLIASGTLTLLLDPAAHARLRADRSLLPSAIEEMLRYTSPVNHATFRFSIEPTTLAGVDIPAGQIVLVGLCSANRDGTRFAEPDAFDLDRARRDEQGGGHVAFGHGIHYCLGAPLARLEAEIAFNGLLDRFPGMTLAVPPSDLRWRPSTLIRGLETLPVRLYG
jgi:cytochrome P450